MSANAFQRADALLVIDMQNSFLRPDGLMRAHRGRSLVDVPGVIERVVEAVDVARRHATPVLYTRHQYRRGYVDAGPRTIRLFEQMGVSPLIEGTWDADLIDEFDPADGILVEKTRMDAFVNTDLEVVLAGLGARRLLLAGIVTNACVESSARAAAMRDHDVTVLGDCCTTYSVEDHEASLSALADYGFAEVLSLAAADSAVAAVP